MCFLKLNHHYFWSTLYVYWFHFKNSGSGRIGKHTIEYAATSQAMVLAVDRINHLLSALCDPTTASVDAQTAL